MGEDKAWLTIGGRPLIEYSLAAIQPVVESIILVTSKAGAVTARYQQLAATWRADLQEDRRPGCGPLAGIESAIRTAEGAVLVLACDLPFVTTELLLALRRIHETERADATVPLDGGGRLEPLVSVYGSNCLSHVQSMLDAGDYKVDRLFSKVSTRFVAFEEIAALRGSDRFFTNINTPAEYAAVQKRSLERDSRNTS
jgi:molybdopterin-guanine dinucleotide biosynthesis protein A